jgi:hypothetical protein
MDFEMSSSRRRDDAIDALYEAGYNAHVPQQRLGDTNRMTVDVTDDADQAAVLSIVLRVDAGATPRGA